MSFFPRGENVPGTEHFLMPLYLERAQQHLSGGGGKIHAAPNCGVKAAMHHCHTHDFPLPG